MAGAGAGVAAVVCTAALAGGGVRGLSSCAGQAAAKKRSERIDAVAGIEVTDMSASFGVANVGCHFFRRESRNNLRPHGSTAPQGMTSETLFRLQGAEFMLNAGKKASATPRDSEWRIGARQS